MSPAVCYRLRLQLAMFVSLVCCRISHTNLSDPEMIKIKCTFRKHHIIAIRVDNRLCITFKDSCMVFWCIFDHSLSRNRINLSLWQAHQKNPVFEIHIFVFLQASLGQTRSQNKILTTDTQLFKENTKGLSLSNCCRAFISLIYKMVLVLWMPRSIPTLIFSRMTLTLAVFGAGGVCLFRDGRDL